MSEVEIGKLEEAALDYHTKLRAWHEAQSQLKSDEFGDKVAFKELMVANLSEQEYLKSWMPDVALNLIARIRTLEAKLEGAGAVVHAAHDLGNEEMKLRESGVLTSMDHDEAFDRLLSLLYPATCSAASREDL